MLVADNKCFIERGTHGCRYSPKPNGLKVALDTIVAPKEAFESIRIAPTWGWALLIAIVLGRCPPISSRPAADARVPANLAKQVATNPQLSSAVPEQQQRRWPSAKRS